MSTTRRRVTAHTSLDDAESDVQRRGDCVLFDVHGLWWSVPLELTIGQVNEQILDELDRLRCGVFPNEPVRPHQRYVRAC